MTKNKVTEEINVQEVENGFLVCISKCGEGKEGWTHEEKKYISKENPLEEEEDKSFSDSLKEIMSELAESEGMIEVD